MERSWPVGSQAASLRASARTAKHAGSMFQWYWSATVLGLWPHWRPCEYRAVCLFSRHETSRLSKVQIQHGLVEFLQVIGHELLHVSVCISNVNK